MRQKLFITVLGIVSAGAILVSMAGFAVLGLILLSSQWNDTQHSPRPDATPTVQLAAPGPNISDLERRIESLERRQVPAPSNPPPAAAPPQIPGTDCWYENVPGQVRPNYRCK